jgi:hypothetical protein
MAGHREARRDSLSVCCSLAIGKSFPCTYESAATGIWGSVELCTKPQCQYVVALAPCIVVTELKSYGKVERGSFSVDFHDFDIFEIVACRRARQPVGARQYF